MSDTCKTEVWDSYSFHVCKRKAVKDGFCKQHHPDAKAARAQASREKYLAQQTQSPYVLLEKAREKIASLTASHAALLAALEYAISMGALTYNHRTKDNAKHCDRCDAIRAAIAAAQKGDK